MHVSAPAASHDMNRRGRRYLARTHLEPLVVSSLGIHENLEGVYLEEVGSLGWVVGAIFCLAGLVQFTDLFGQATIIFLVEPEPCEFGVCLEPQTLIVCGLERLECSGVELFHALVGIVIVGILLDEIQHVVDGFLRIVPRDGRLDIGQQFLVMLNGLVVSTQSEFELDGLLETLETPSR